MLDETVTYLEMTSPSKLAPGRPPSARLEIQELGRAEAPMLRSTYARIGGPHGWTGRSAWSGAQWEEQLSRPGIQAWIARVDDDVVGLVELEAESNGDVGIVVFGLVPEFVGRGFGGALLTLATRLAWKVKSPRWHVHETGVGSDFLTRPSARKAELRTSGLSNVPNRAQAAGKLARGERMDQTELTTLTSRACSPFGPSSTSYSTFAPSARLL
jgi:RimJ/RimL family protein N-acetyltransferase